VSSGTADDATTLFNPHGITSYGGNLYVTDDVNHKIYKTVIATSKMSTLAGSGEVYIEEGEEGYDGTIKLDGKGTEATFGEPEGIIANGKNLYIADTSNNRIRKIVIATGVVTTLAGSGTQGSDDHTGTEASFSQPTGITTDGSNLYVTDMRNQKIRKVVIATGMVTTFAGTGTIGDIDGTGKAASFNFPQAITTDGTNLFVADTNNNKIRKIVIATGVVSTVAGSGVAGSLDGKGSEASFQNALGITTDGHHIYVADTNNHRIRKISIATGEVTTLAGSKIRGFNDGNGTSATFNYPRGITINGSNLYVADYFNHTLRKIVIDTGEVSTLAGAEK
jgi:sugar lactone lactonase YvrE